VTGRVVLLVDPDDVLRESTAAALGRGGHTVVEANSRDQAFRRYLQHRPGAVILAVDRADEQPVALCRQFRALPGADHLVIMVLAGEIGDDTMLERSFAAGATDCLPRPVNYVLLCHRLGQLLDARVNGIALARSRRRLAAAQHVARLGDWHFDGQRDAVSWSREVSRLLRIPLDRVRAATLEAFLGHIHADDRPFVSEAVAGALADGTPFSFETRVICADGALRTVRFSGQREQDPLTDAVGLSGILHDITDRRTQQEQLRFLAYYDQVTRLPNRARLEDAIRRLTARDGAGRDFAVISLGLDNHQRATESLGRDAVDGLLRMIADRLDAAVRARPAEGHARPREGAGSGGARRRRDLVARVGGYEFAVLIEDFADGEAVEEIGRCLCERLAEPFQLDGHQIYLTASAGVAVHPVDSGSGDDPLRAADTALADASRKGGGRCVRFIPRMSDTVRVRSVRELALRHALEQNRFLLHYQPRVDLRGNKVMGAEALVRMCSPHDDSLVPPAEFVPLAEELGLIVDIGRVVIARALRQLREWRRLGLVDRDFVMSVNISPRQFADAGLFEHIERCLRDEQIPPSCLELEITEGTIVTDLELTARLLAARRELGIRVAIDDYGTGYSSLAYLRGLPVDTLKIDRCFVQGLGADQTDEAIVRFTIQLAHQLNLDVCAEGVESQAQLDCLRAQQCDQVQGFHFGRPMPAEELTARLTPAPLREEDARPAVPVGAAMEAAAVAAAAVRSGAEASPRPGAPAKAQATDGAADAPVVLCTHDEALAARRRTERS
jgi:PAS domain S-box-containing protein